MNADLIVFSGLALVAIVAALGMIFSRNAVYSAIFLIINFVTVAIFYLILGASFIALTQVTIYAGAIMVLFLFVIMLLGAEQVGRTPGNLWMRPTSILLGLVLLGEMVYLIFLQRDLAPAMPPVAARFGSPAQVGEELFNHYLLPFEVTSILLLSAMIGAIVLTKRKSR